MKLAIYFLYPSMSLVRVLLLLLHLSTLKIKIILCRARYANKPATVETLESNIVHVVCDIQQSALRQEQPW